MATVDRAEQKFLRLDEELDGIEKVLSTIMLWSHPLLFVRDFWILHWCVKLVSVWINR